MGFFDSFKEGFQGESQKTSTGSNYRTVAQREKDRFNTYRNESDSTLLRKMKGIFTSDEDKDMINEILKSRGYRRNTNGNYDRW